MTNEADELRRRREELDALDHDLLDLLAKRIDAMAMAIWNDMTADDLVNADLSYAPPFSGVWDPVLHAARLMQSELDR